MVSYKRLWETMKQKNISQYRLIKYYEFSAGQIGRLKKNMYVSTHTIEILCTILDCPVEHIMEVIPDPTVVEWKNQQEEQRLAKQNSRKKKQKQQTSASTTDSTDEA